MKQNQQVNKKYLGKVVLITLAGFFISGCSSVSTEVSYVFSPEQAVENPFPKDTMCPSKTSNYAGDVPAYYALYKPNNDLTATIRLVPTERNIHTVGPGFFVPLPVVPEPVGNLKTVAYDASNAIPTEQLEKVQVVIYPNPFKKGYFFTPSQVQLNMSGHKLNPEKITKLYTKDHSELEIQEKGITREKLKWQSGEYLAYLLEFNVDRLANTSVVLTIKGFDLNGKPVSEQNYKLNASEATVMDWQYDVDCN